MPPKPRPLPERLWPKVDRRGPDDCWPWTASKTSAGYGQLNRGARGEGNVLAHRAVYELMVGPIDPAAVLDHTCHGRDKACPGNAGCPHRACVNPAHLEQVTFGENCMRGRGIAPRNALKTHCNYGHALEGHNVIRAKRNGARGCRICENRRQRERARRRRAALVGT